MNNEEWSTVDAQEQTHIGLTIKNQNRISPKHSSLRSEIPYHVITFILVAVMCLTGCGGDTNGPGTQSPEIVADSTLIFAHGGDPRGIFRPNEPFVFTFDSTDRFSGRSGDGVLRIQGQTTSSGMFSLILSTRVSGSVGTIMFANIGAPETTSGTWSSNGVMLYTSSGGRNTAIPYTADERGVYLLPGSFSSVPPLSRFYHGPGEVPNHPTVWVFKRQ